MRTLHRITLPALISTLAMTGAVVSGCVATPPAEPSPSTSPSSAPLFASEEEALAAATEAYAAYQQMSDLILSEGGRGPERIDELAAGEARNVAHTSFESFRNDGYRIVGRTEIRNVSLQQYLPGEPSGDVVNIYFCLNISGVDVLDEEGSSVVQPTRPNEQAFEASVTASDNQVLVTTRDAWTGAGVCD